VGDELHRPYDRPPLSKVFLAGELEADSLQLEDADDELHAEWFLGTSARPSISPARCRVDRR
jgi:hypothetical protein